MVANGAASVPGAASLPPLAGGATKTPSSLTTHGSVALDGGSLFGKQSPPHAWNALAHEIPHPRPASPVATHVAVPCVDAGPAHATAHDPQCAGCVGSTHAPLQSSGVPPSGSQPTPHVPLEHVAWPTPASGPGHTLAHDPQCSGAPGSTHCPEHAMAPALSHAGPASPGATSADPGASS